MRNNDKSPKVRAFSKDRPARKSGGDRPNSSKKRVLHREGDEASDENGAKRNFRSERNDRPKRPYTRKSDNERGERRPYTRKSDDERGERRPYTRKSDDERGERRPYTRKSDNERGERRSFSKGNDDRKRSFSKGTRPEITPKRRKRRDVTAESEILTEIVDRRKREGRPSKAKVQIRSLEYEEQYTPVHLNKYIANAGVCSRREADTLIVAGAIAVNGNVVTELGFKVNPTDEVRFGDKVLQREKPVYLLLNKPKDYITTMYDEFDRKDVMELVRGACKERIYPVGRLDRDTTGLLLFTNDGEMTKKLTHPKHKIKKIYHVSLDKNLKVPDFEAIVNGLEFDDEMIVPDELAYVGNSKSEIGITIHSGKNRIVRRIFESLGYQVEKLDRVIFAGLTKKDLPRGSWRFLTQGEINILKMIN